MTIPRDAIGLSERLRMPWDDGFAIHAPRPIELEAATALDALQARVKELEAARMGQIDYSVDLQRIIEGLCHGRTIREPQTGARHHYDMAIEYQARATRLQQERDEAYERAIKCIPTNWCDELLTGPRAPRGPLDSPAVERLLLEIIKRIRRLAGPDKEKRE